MSEKNKLKSSIKYPTSLIINGNDFLGVEIAKSLIEQGGYVIVIDNNVEATLERYKDIDTKNLLTVLDFSSVEYLDEDLRRLDYVFFLAHEYTGEDEKLSSQEFLQASNYLDLIINVAHKFEAKFLLSSSIRAHQILVNNPDLAIGIGEEKKKYSIYTQMEIQRYAEALIIESIEKLKLDARIVRMGRIIGVDMQFNPENSFDRLVFQAAKGEDLTLDSDGLETNMYIHVLDAAYGLIKAMFTKGTKGKIYSLSNEEEVNDLSIAYKLQELSGMKSEIKFVDKNSGFAQIKIHNPGIRLSTIGWSPRIPFIRAISQVLDYVNYLLAKQHVKADGGSEEGEAQEDMTKVQDPDEPRGALARLIAERKAQQKARRGSILMAQQKLRARSKQKNRTLTTGERIQRKIQAVYDQIAFKLTFLKRITIIEALIYFVLLIIFFAIYIGIISPVFVIAKNIVVIEYEQNKLEENFQKEDLQAVSANTEDIHNSVEGLNQSVKKLENIFNLTGQDVKYNAMSSYIQYLDLYTRQVSDSMEIISTFDDQWKNGNVNVEYLPNTDGLFRVVDAGDDESSISTIKSYQSRIDLNIETMQNTSDHLSELSSSKILGYNTGQIAQKLQKREDSVVQVMKLVKNYSTLMFNENVQTYAIIVQDNSRYTPAGGYPASIGYIKVQNGTFKDIYLEPVNVDNDSVISDLTDSQLKQVQLSSSNVVSKSEVKLSDLFLMQDRQRFADNINAYYTDRYSETPDAIFFIDTETLANMLEESGSIEINQVKIEKNSMLNSITLLQGSDKSVDKRNEIITNIFAAEVNSILQKRESLYGLLPVFYDGAKSYSVWIDSNDPDISSEVLGDADNHVSSSDWLSFAIASDPSVTDSEVFPSISVSIEDEIASDSVITREIKLKKGNTKDLERIIVCMPASSYDFNFPDNKVTAGQAFTDNEICVVGDFDLASELTFSYKINKGIENLGSGLYNKSLALIPTPGVDVSYDYKASIPVEYNFENEDSLVISDRKMLESSSLSEYKLINFKYSK